MKLERLIDPAYRYCNYCAAEYSYVITGTDDFSYVACSRCFNAAVAHPAELAAIDAACWNEDFRQHARTELMKAVYQDPATDEATKTKIMAEILSGKEKDTE